jgi:hypothetical protein
MNAQTGTTSGETIGALLLSGIELSTANSFNNNFRLASLGSLIGTIFHDMDISHNLNGGDLGLSGILVTLV